MNTTSSPLRDVVILGGLALQSTDCAIRAAGHHRGEHGGLARIENERHHQFIIWRAILPIWPCLLERDNNTDLVLDCDNARHHFELKNWISYNGEKELPSIRRDVAKMQGRLNGYILITSLNPANDTDQNIDFLLARVEGLDDSRRQDFCFKTVGLNGKEIEFWIAGWPVSKT